jgi:hypothetical protein
MRFPRALLGALLIVLILGAEFPYAFAAPSTILTGTSAISYAIRDPNQRHLFYSTVAGKYFWVGSDDTNAVYEYSSDGSTWTGKKSLGIGLLYGEWMAVYYDSANNKVYWAGSYGGSTNTILYYARLTPHSNGTLTFDKPIQTAVAANINTAYSAINVGCDSSGYPYVSYTAVSSYPWVTKSSTNDGTWSTASGFPYQLSSSASSATAVIPFTSLKMLFIYGLSSATTIRAKEFDGSSTWGAEKATASNWAYNWGTEFSAVSFGNDVCGMAYLKSGLSLQYTTFTYSLNAWAADSQIQASVATVSCPSLSYDSTNDNIYCYWMGSPTANHIYYKELPLGSSWDANPTDWVTDATLYSNAEISSFFNSYGVGIGVGWMQYSGSTYNVRFNLLNLSSKTYTETSTYAYSITKSSAEYATRILSSVYGFTVSKSSLEYAERVLTSTYAFTVVKSSTEYAERLLTSTKAFTIAKSSAEYATRILSSVYGFTVSKSSLEYAERVLTSTYAFTFGKSSVEYIEAMANSVYSFTLTKSSVEYVENVLSSTYGFVFAESSSVFTEYTRLSNYAVTFIESSSSILEYVRGSLYTFSFIESSAAQAEYYLNSIYNFTLTETTGLEAEFIRSSTYAFTLTESSVNQLEYTLSSVYGFVLSDSSSVNLAYQRISTYAFSFTEVNLEYVERIVNSAYNFVFTESSQGLIEYLRGSIYAFSFTVSSITSKIIAAIHWYVTSTYNFIVSVSSGTLAEFYRSCTYGFSIVTSSAEYAEWVITSAYGFAISGISNALFTLGGGGVNTRYFMFCMVVFSAIVLVILFSRRKR